MKSTITQKTEAVADSINGMLENCKQINKGNFELVDYSWKERFITFSIGQSQATHTLKIDLEDFKASIDKMPEVEDSYEITDGSFIVEMEQSGAELSPDEYVSHMYFEGLAKEILADLAKECIDHWNSGEFGRFFGKASRMGLHESVVSEMESDIEVTKGFQVELDNSMKKQGFQIAA